MDSPMSLNCTQVDGTSVRCDGEVYILQESEEITTTLFWTYIGIYVSLVLFAGLMSGLTMGLLSLDIMSLKVLGISGKPKEKIYAKKIIPIVKKHHLLLVTLLLANAAAVESMPIFLDKITNPIIAILISVTAVLIFGEVIPQAICTRYGLAIGATLSPLVWLFMLILFPIAFPIAKVLDLLLGKDHGTFFRRAELGALVDLHGENSEENENPLSVDEILIIKGALTMRDKCAKDAFTPLKSVYMLNVNDILDRHKIDEIIERGHSRVPVYKNDNDLVDITGILLIKSLLKVDFHKPSTVHEVLLKYGRSIARIPASMPLYDVLNAMQDGQSHINLVTNEITATTHISANGGHNNALGKTSDAEVVVIGIITLEDILEELLQEEIVDETDIYVDVHKRVKVARAKLSRANSEFHSDTPQSTEKVSKYKRFLSVGHSSKYQDGGSPTHTLPEDVNYDTEEKDHTTDEDADLTGAIDPAHRGYSINEESTYLDTSPLIPDLD